MQRGYIKIWRKLEDSGLLQMHGTFCLFIHMLLKATHKDLRIGMTDLKRGQFISGRHQLAEAVGLSEQQLRTCEKKLHLLGMIESKSTNKFTVYTIVNYDIYQDANDADNKQITNEQQTSNKQLTTIQEHKNKITKEESLRFDEFWELWPRSPRKGGKANCLKVWKSRNLDSEAETIFSHIKYCKSNGVWKDPQFISAPLVYLNQTKWDGAEIISDNPAQFSMDDFMRKVNG